MGFIQKVPIFEENDFVWFRVLVVLGQFYVNLSLLIGISNAAFKKWRNYSLLLEPV